MNSIFYFCYVVAIAVPELSLAVLIKQDLSIPSKNRPLMIDCLSLNAKTYETFMASMLWFPFKAAKGEQQSFVLP